MSGMMAEGGAAAMPPDRWRERASERRDGMERVIKRGAVVVAFDPLLVTWRGRSVPLSRIEGEVYAHVCRRGRVSLAELSTVLAGLGASVETRSLVLGHIRGKFVRMGACSPFEKVGGDCIRLVVDPDDAGSVATVVGMELPRYAIAARA